MTEDISGQFEEKLNQYREQLGDIARDENQRFSKLAQQHAQQIVQEAWGEAEEIIQKSQQKAADILNKGKSDAGQVVSDSQRSAADIVLTARKKADEVIGEGKKQAEAIVEASRGKAAEVAADIEKEAQAKAEVILEEARTQGAELVRRTEEDLNRQLKEKMRAQKDKILAEAREEAEDIITQAKEQAEQEGRSIVEALRRETQEKLEEETRAFQAYTQQQTEEIRGDTEKRAAELLRAIDQDSRGVNGLLADSIKRYEVILQQLKEAVQSEVGEVAKNVTAAKKQIENKLTSYSAGEAEDEATRTVKAPSASSLWVTLGGPTEGDALNSYKGRLDLKTLSIVDHRKIRSLKTFLTRIQNVKYIGESSNDEGTVLSFEVTEPMPLMEILDNIPDVMTSEQSGNNIKLILN